MNIWDMKTIENLLDENPSYELNWFQNGAKP